MAHMESLWPRLAELPLVVESCEYDRLHTVLAHEFERVTTHVWLAGAGADGLGEDVSVHVEDGGSGSDSFDANEQRHIRLLRHDLSATSHEPPARLGD